MKCSEINTGLLRHRVCIEREQEVTDSVGGLTTTWQQIYTAYAYIKPTTGQERLQALQLESNVSHRIYLRWFRDIQTKDRLIYDGREFHIDAIINIEERNKFYELLCSEGPVN